MTDPYLGNMSQSDDSGGRISSREPIACPMCQYYSFNMIDRRQNLDNL